VHINSRSGKSDRDYDSAVVAATISLRDLVGDSQQPTARIDVEDFSDSSGMNAPTLVRHKLQDLIELYLPDVEIEGRKKMVEKRFAIDNPHDEPLKVWIQLQNRQVRDRAYRWKWEPGQPGTEEAYQFLIPAKTPSPVTLRYEDSRSESSAIGPLHGSRVRIWAESESGLGWTEHRHRDLWLVEENFALGGERAYDAEEMEMHVYRIPSKTGPRVFTERLLAFRNDTSEQLRINFRYLNATRGVQTWRSQSEILLQPGQSTTPRNEEGLRIRASQVQVRAIGESLHFGQDRAKPRWLIDEINGLRVYRAEKIGDFIYSFKMQPNTTSSLTN
jgi:hypothetical protein